MFSVVCDRVWHGETTAFGWYYDLLIAQDYLTHSRKYEVYAFVAINDTAVAEA